MKVDKNIRKAYKISNDIFVKEVGDKNLNISEVEKILVKHNKSNKQWIKDHVDIVARAIAHHSQKYEVLKMKGVEWSYSVYGIQPQNLWASYVDENKRTHIYVLSLYDESKK